MKRNSLKDKVIVITGSGRGIGRALAEYAGRQGAKVILNGRTEETLKSVSASLCEKGVECRYVKADVSDMEESGRLMEKAAEYYGRIDILVNNAGIAGKGLFSETKGDTWTDILKINTLGYIFPTLAALPYLKESRGSLVFVSSIAARAGILGHSTYSVSKMALTALSQALDLELAEAGIHTGIVYVGFVANDPEKRILDGDGTMKKMGKRPSFLQMPPEKVASAIGGLILRRKRSKVLSWPGHLQSLFFLFPFVRRMVLRNALRQYHGMYED